MAARKPFLVFDIGGTSFRAALYDLRSRRIDCLATSETPPLAVVQDRRAALAEIVDMMKVMAKKLMPATEPDSICVGFPGPVDAEGNVYAAPTIWGEQYQNNLPFRRLLFALWPQADIEVVNDVTAAGYYFVDEVTRDFLVVTVGSGIGSKLFIGGEPVLGPHSRGGELGHLRVDFSPAALPCDCGGIGHLGAVASGRGILRSAVRQAGEDPAGFARSSVHALCEGQPRLLTNEMLVKALSDGDVWIRTVIYTCTAFLGQILAATHLNMGIEKYKIVGGFASAIGDDYQKMLAETASSAMWRNGFSWRDAIQVSKVTDHPGLNGAGRMLQSKYGRF